MSRERLKKKRNRSPSEVEMTGFELEEEKRRLEEEARLAGTPTASTRPARQRRSVSSPTASSATGTGSASPPLSSVSNPTTSVSTNTASQPQTSATTKAAAPASRWRLTPAQKKGLMIAGAVLVVAALFVMAAMIPGAQLVFLLPLAKLMFAYVLAPIANFFAASVFAPMLGWLGISAGAGAFYTGLAIASTLVGAALLIGPRLVGFLVNAFKEVAKSTWNGMKAVFNFLSDPKNSRRTGFTLIGVGAFLCVFPPTFLVGLAVVGAGAVALAVPYIQKYSGRTGLGLLALGGACYIFPPAIPIGIALQVIGAMVLAAPYVQRAFTWLKDKWVNRKAPATPATPTVTTPSAPAPTTSTTPEAQRDQTVARDVTKYVEDILSSSGHSATGQQAAQAAKDASADGPTAAGNAAAKVVFNALLSKGIPADQAQKYANQVFSGVNKEYGGPSTPTPTTSPSSVGVPITGSPTGSPPPTTGSSTTPLPGQPPGSPPSAALSSSGSPRFTTPSSTPDLKTTGSSPSPSSVGVPITGSPTGSPPPTTGSSTTPLPGRPSTPPPPSAFSSSGSPRSTTPPSTPDLKTTGSSPSPSSPLLSISKSSVRSKVFKIIDAEKVITSGQSAAARKIDIVAKQAAENPGSKTPAHAASEAARVKTAEILQEKGVSQVKALEIAQAVMKTVAEQYKDYRVESKSVASTTLTPSVTRAPAPILIPKPTVNAHPSTIANSRAANPDGSPPVGDNKDGTTLGKTN